MIQACQALQVIASLGTCIWDRIYQGNMYRLHLMLINNHVYTYILSHPVNFTYQYCKQTSNDIRADCANVSSVPTCRTFGTSKWWATAICYGNSSFKHRCYPGRKVASQDQPARLNTQSLSLIPARSRLKIDCVRKFTKSSAAICKKQWRQAKWD